MGVTNNGNSFVGDSRALHVLPRGYYRAHLYTGPTDEFLLSEKRTVERSVNPENVRMQCGKVKAVIEKDEYSEKMRIVKILEDKYDSSGYTK